MVNRKILILILIGLVVFFSVVIFSSKNKLENETNITNTKEPALKLSPEKIIIHQSEDLSLNILIDTNNIKSSGAGVILHFNPTVIEATSIIQGEVFGLYPSKKINNNTGVIKISGVSWDSKLGKPSLPFLGTGIFAKVKFKSKTLSEEIKTPITFEYINYRNTTDSNILEAKTAKDILKVVENAEITIRP